MRWLLDTNILSELRRPKPEPEVVGFVAKGSLLVCIAQAFVDQTQVSRKTASMLLPSGSNTKAA
jgi:hypothetical protein